MSAASSSRASSYDEALATEASCARTGVGGASSAATKAIRVPKTIGRLTYHEERMTSPEVIAAGTSARGKAGGAASADIKFSPD
jgi:hypothetical protein